MNQSEVAKPNPQSTIAIVREYFPNPVFSKPRGLWIKLKALAHLPPYSSHATPPCSAFRFPINAGDLCRGRCGKHFASGNVQNWTADTGPYPQITVLSCQHG